MTSTRYILALVFALLLATAASANFGLICSWPHAGTYTGVYTGTSTSTGSGTGTGTGTGGFTGIDTGTFTSTGTGTGSSTGTGTGSSTGTGTGSSTGTGTGSSTGTGTGSDTGTGTGVWVDASRDSLEWELLAANTNVGALTMYDTASYGRNIVAATSSHMCGAPTADGAYTYVTCNGAAMLATSAVIASAATDYFMVEVWDFQGDETFHGNWSKSNDPYLEGLVISYENFNRIMVKTGYSVDDMFVNGSDYRTGKHSFLFQVSSGGDLTVYLDGSLYAAPQTCPSPNTPVRAGCSFAYDSTGYGAITARFYARRFYSRAPTTGEKAAGVLMWGH